MIIQLGNDQKLIVPGKFTVKEVVPGGSVASDSREVETGKDVTIEGTNLNVVSAVRLTKAGRRLVRHSHNQSRSNRFLPSKHRKWMPTPNLQ